MYNEATASKIHCKISSSTRDDTNWKHQNRKMKALIIDIPSSYLPAVPYHNEELAFYLFSANKTLPNVGMLGPRNTMQILFYQPEIINLQKVMTDLIVFFNFLRYNEWFLQWKVRTPSNKIGAYADISSVQEYVRENQQEPEDLFSVSFESFSINEIIRETRVVNFHKLFMLFYGLTEDDKEQQRTKELINFYSFNVSSASLLYRVYNNIYAQISNTFILIEALINQSEIEKSESRTCLHCSRQVKGRKSMRNLISEFLDTLDLDPSYEEILVKVLNEHYLVRNKFFHDAQHNSLSRITDAMIKVLGHKTFTINDEIKHASASLQGLYIVNAFIKQELVKRLEKTIA